MRWNEALAADSRWKSARQTLAALPGPRATMETKEAPESKDEKFVVKPSYKNT